MTLSILTLQRSQLRSYSKYSQFSPALVLERAVIQAFRQPQWMCLMEPEHLQILSSGFFSVDQRQKHTLQNYALSASQPRLDEDSTLRMLRSMYLLFLRYLELVPFFIGLPKLMFSLMSAQERVMLRLSCRPWRSLQLRQIFLTVNSISASLRLSPSFSSTCSSTARDFHISWLVVEIFVSWRVGCPQSSLRLSSYCRSPYLLRWECWSRLSSPL